MNRRFVAFLGLIVVWFWTVPPAQAQVPLVMVSTPAGDRPVQCSSELAHAAGRDCAWFYAHLTDGAPVLGEPGLTWHHGPRGWEIIQVNLGSLSPRPIATSVPAPPLTLAPSPRGLMFSDGTVFNLYEPLTPAQQAALEAFRSQAAQPQAPQKTLVVGRCYANPYGFVSRVVARLTLQRLYGDPFDDVTSGDTYLLEATTSGVISTLAAEMVRENLSFRDVTCPMPSR